MTIVNMVRLQQIAEVEFAAWERKAIDGTIYRHDNAPHQRWQSIATFPHHFHDGSETSVTASHLSLKPEVALREFLTFVQQRLKEITDDKSCS